MPLDDLRTSDLDRAEAALTRASAALRSSETDFDAGEMDEAEFTAFLSRALGLLAANSLSGSLHSSAWIGATWASFWRPASRPTPS